MIDKIFIVKGEKGYIHDFLYPTCDWTENKVKSKPFPTYSKANTFAKKINKFFGYKKVKVETMMIDKHTTTEWEYITSKL